MSYQIKNRHIVMQRARATASKVVDTLSIELQKEIRKNLNTGASNGGKSPGPPGGFPYKNTGTLARSIQIDRGDRSGSKITNRVGTKIKYAKVHEFGGAIHARGGALTIPLNTEAKMLRQRTSGSLRGVGGLFLFKTKAGAFLAKSIGKRAKLKLMFALKKSVRIPARPFMRPSLANVRRRARDIAMSVLRPSGAK